MPIRHVVVQGECLPLIALRYGFTDYKKIYDHPDNAALKKNRPDPNVLHPGDEWVVPDKASKSVSLATGQAHKVVVKSPKRQIQLRFQDDLGQPLAGRPFRLSWEGGKSVEGKTDGDGVIKADVPLHLSTVTLKMGPSVRKLHLANLNPMRGTPDGGVTGVQARLANLGYSVGAVDGDLGPRTTAAIEEFQRHEGLAVTGTIDDSLMAALEKAYGC